MNITVKYERGAIKFAERMLATRPRNDDLARLAGALDGATVEINQAMVITPGPDSASTLISARKKFSFHRIFQWSKQPMI
jgi:hypothetical protein